MIARWRSIIQVLVVPTMVCFLVQACAPKPPVVHAKPDTAPTDAVSPKGHVCTQIPSLSNAPEPIDGALAPIIRIEVRGSKTPAAICESIHSRPGAAVDDQSVEGDVRRIWALGDIDDVVVARELAPGGVVVAFEVKPRQRFVSARIDGVRTADVGRDEDYLPDPGPLDPVKIHESVLKLSHALADKGFRHAQIDTRTEPREDEGLELVLAVNLGVRSVVNRIDFPGADPARTGELSRLLTTHTGAPILADALERDVLVVTAFYYDHGMLNVRVHPAVIKESAGGESLDVAIEVEEGPVYKVGVVKFVGDLLDREADYKKRFWSSPPQAIFSRAVIVQDLDRIREYHRLQGFNADVEPETTMSPDKKIVDVTIRVKKH